MLRQASLVQQAARRAANATTRPSAAWQVAPAASLRAPKAQVTTTAPSVQWQQQRTELPGRRQGETIAYTVLWDKPGFNRHTEIEFETMARDGFGCPAYIPPEVSTTVRHTLYVPPQYYPFLKKIGEDTPSLKPYMERLVLGQMTLLDYEEMFYRFTKPLKIDRKLVAMPYRTADEVKKEEEVQWESAWLSFRQRVKGDYDLQYNMRDWLVGIAIGIYISWLWVLYQRQYRVDMKLFYLEAPEHKINWVIPRGDV